MAHRGFGRPLWMAIGAAGRRGCRFQLEISAYQFGVVGYQFAVISLAVVGSWVPVVARILKPRGVQPETANCRLPTVNR